ncbi:hypothetical protein HELRODRAFT_168515 [Helobdella robusta]|uniref:Uncharacterized protein n=1 Tax=Helobdella robusta TaxID=6412 RepID=T1F0N4_HELRO|nr:hypothetical protein HELRODRAFT_168515 [Helobdella robusta]ESO09521.1 hypothetical protein HELRODRAFT_168515 [Helobdella robusta]
MFKQCRNKKRKHFSFKKFMMEVSSDTKETFLGSKSLFGMNDSTRASRCSLYNVIEADYLQGWDFQENSDDKSISNHINPALLDLDHNSCHSTFYDIMEEELDECSVEMLRKKLTGVLSKDFTIRDRHCRLFVPMDLIKRISADVVRMSQLEPRGVDGGRLIVKLDFDGCETDLGRVCSSNSSTSANDDVNNEILYEINLTLKEDSKNWPSFKQLAFMLPSMVCCRLNQPKQTIVYVGPGYKLEKVKLYKNVNVLNSPNLYLSNGYLNNNNRILPNRNLIYSHNNNNSRNDANDNSVNNNKYINNNNNNNDSNMNIVDINANNLSSSSISVTVDHDNVITNNDDSTKDDANSNLLHGEYSPTH